MPCESDKKALRVGPEPGSNISTAAYDGELRGRCTSGVFELRAPVDGPDQIVRAEPFNGGGDAALNRRAAGQRMLGDYHANAPAAQGTTAMLNLPATNRRPAGSLLRGVGHCAPCGHPGVRWLLLIQSRRVWPKD
jgi:hypothetical protein